MKKLVLCLALISFSESLIASPRLQLGKPELKKKSFEDKIPFSFQLTHTADLGSIIEAIVTEAKIDGTLNAYPEEFKICAQKIRDGKKTVTVKTLNPVMPHVLRRIAPQLFEENEQGLDLSTMVTRAMRIQQKQNQSINRDVTTPVTPTVDLSQIIRLLCEILKKLEKKPEVICECICDSITCCEEILDELDNIDEKLEKLHDDLDECCENLEKSIEKNREIIEECCDEIKEEIEECCDEIKDEIEECCDEIKEAITECCEFLADKIDEKREDFEECCDEIKDEINICCDEIKEEIEECCDEIKEAITECCEFLADKIDEKREAFEECCDEIKDEIEECCDEIKDDIEECCEEIKEAITECCDDIKREIEECCDEIKEEIEECCDEIKDDIEECCDEIKEAITECCDDIKREIEECCDEIKDEIEECCDEIKEEIEECCEDIQDAITECCELLCEKIERIDSVACGIPIRELPFTITAPGNYFLSETLTINAGDGITILSDNVVLDLCCNTIIGNGAENGIVIGDSFVPLKNIMIKNGIIDNMNEIGILARRIQNLQIKEVTASRCVVGFYLIDCQDSVARECTAVCNTNHGFLLEGFPPIRGKYSDNRFFDDQCPINIESENRHNCIINCRALSTRSNEGDAYGFRSIYGFNNTFKNCIAKDTHTDISAIAAGFSLENKNIGLNGSNESIICQECDSKIIDCQVCNTTANDSIEFPLGRPAGIQLPLSFDPCQCRQICCDDSNVDCQENPSFTSFLTESRWSPNGSFLATIGSQDVAAILRIFKVDKTTCTCKEVCCETMNTDCQGNPLNDPVGLEFLDWSPNGCYISTIERNAGISRIRIFKINQETGACKQICCEEITMDCQGASTEDRILRLAWSPDSCFFAIQEATPFTTETARVRVFEVDKKAEECKQVCCQELNTDCQGNTTSSVLPVALKWSPQGQFFASIEEDTSSGQRIIRIRLFKVHQREKNCEQTCCFETLVDCNNNAGLAVVFTGFDWSPDGSLFATSEFQVFGPSITRIRVFKVHPTGSCNQICCIEPLLNCAGEPITDTLVEARFKWAPSSKFLAVLENQRDPAPFGRLRIFEVDKEQETCQETCCEEFTTDCNLNPVNFIPVQLDWSPDGCFITTTETFIGGAAQQPLVNPEVSRVRLFKVDKNSGDCMQTCCQDLATNCENITIPNTSRTAIDELKWSPNGCFFATRERESGQAPAFDRLRIFMVDKTTGECEQVCCQELDTDCQNNPITNSRVRQFDWSSDGCLISTIENQGQEFFISRLRIFNAGVVFPKNCEIKNNQVTNTNGGCEGIGILGDCFGNCPQCTTCGCNNLIIKNIAYSNDVAYKGVSPVFAGGVKGDPTIIDNLAFPPICTPEMCPERSEIEECCDEIKDEIEECCDELKDTITVCCQDLSTQLDVCCDEIQDTVDECCDELKDTITTCCQDLSDQLSECCDTITSIINPLGTLITELPFTINEPGTYILAVDATVISGNAITIASNNVSLDLGSRTINGIGAIGINNGIIANNVSNIIIKNGSIVNMLGIGISLEDSTNVTIENVNVLSCSVGIEIRGTTLIVDPTVDIAVSLNIKINGCRFYRNSLIGLLVSGVKDIIVDKCAAIENGLAPDNVRKGGFIFEYCADVSVGRCFGSGNLLGYLFALVHNAALHKCVALLNVEDGYRLQGEDVMAMTVKSDQICLLGCKALSNQQIGISLESCESCSVHECESKCNGAEGINLASDVEFNSVRLNTLTSNGSYGIYDHRAIFAVDLTALGILGTTLGAVLAILGLDSADPTTNRCFGNHANNNNGFTNVGDLLIFTVGTNLVSLELGDKNYRNVPALVNLLPGVVPLTTIVAGIADVLSNISS